MKYKRTAGSVIVDALVYGFVALAALLCVFPIWHVLMSSFTEGLTLTNHTGILLWPKNFSLEGYQMVFANRRIWTGYINTIIYTVATTLLGTFLSAMGGYVFSRKNVLFAKALMLVVVVTMFFSGGVIPLFLVINALGMYNTRWALILPSCLSAFNIIIMRAGMAAIPGELEEAAMIDGAGRMRVFWSIFLPLSKASLAVVALFIAVANWNAWFNASIFLSAQNRDLHPLQLVIRDILINNSMSGMAPPGAGIAISFYESLLQNVAIIVSSLPLIIIYPFIQKNFEKGVLLGGVKG